MFKKYFLALTLSVAFIHLAVAQKNKKEQSKEHSNPAQKPAINTSALTIKPYTRPNPAAKQNGIGVYPNLKNSKTWDGTEPGSYSLKFVIKGLQKGDTVYLADYMLDGKYRRDTAYVDGKGVANFTGNIKLQRGFYLFVFPHIRDYFDFIVDDDQDFTIYTDTSYEKREYYTHMKVVGSEQNAAYVQYLNGKEAIITGLRDADISARQDSSAANIKIQEAKHNMLIQQKMNYDSTYIARYPDHLLSRFLYALIDIEVPKELQTSKDSNAGYVFYKTHYWDHIDFNEDGLIRLPFNIMKQKLDFYFDKVIPPDADTNIKAAKFLLSKVSNSIEMEKYIIWYLVNRYETSNIMGLDKAFVEVAGLTYCQGKAWWVDSSTVRRMCDNVRDRSWTQIGNPAPPIELADKNGNWVEVNNIKAPYTILIFWDPTCGHCREVMPKLAKIYNENKAKGWKVVALAPLDHKKEWIEYQQEHPEMSEFIHLLRGEVRSEYWAANLRKYYVIASPTIFILDENKVVRANRIDVDKIPEFLNFLDREKAKKAAKP